MLKRLGAVLIILGLAFAIPSAPAIAAVPSGLTYVALGDSYSAGFGLTPFSTTWPADGCFQADDNYPKQVAAALNLDLGTNDENDRTCSGAITDNITTTPQVTMPPFSATAPLQGTALSADTDIVTLTIGGNDLGFADVATFCIALEATGPLSGPIGEPNLNNCKEHYVTTVGGITIDQLADKLKFVVSLKLISTFNWIKQQAPNARVFVVGYPQIAPDFAKAPTGCYSSLLNNGTFTPPLPQDTVPYQTVDIHYLHHVEDLMDQWIQDAAGIAGFTYIPTWAATADHTVCAGTESFIFGVGLTTDPQKGTETPLSGYYVTLGALHPKPTGVGFLASQVIAAIQAHPDFAEAAPAATLPATGPQPLNLVGLSIALLGAGMAAVGLVRRRVTLQAARR